MSHRGMIAALVTGLAVMWAAPVQALDLGAPVKALEKMLGKKPAPAQPSPAPARIPPARAGGTSVKPVPASPGSVAKPAGAATADSSGADSGALDEILLTPEPYYYQSVGRRDPFVSLVGEEYLSEHEGEDLSTDQIFVRGILWGENDKFALVETSTGQSCILREGDTIGPYSVTRVEPSAITVYTSEYGVGRTVRLPMTQGKGSKHERGEG
jgi:hypothetical protein